MILPATIVAVSFLDDRTVQIRAELGRVEDAAIVQGIPAGAVPAPDADGWVWMDGRWAGRILGDAWMGTDGYEASPMQAVFDGGAADRAGAWSVRADGAPVAVTSVARKAQILDSAETGWGEHAFRTAQTVTLTLAEPLDADARVAVDHADAAFDAVTVRRDGDAPSEAIHANLLGFHPDDAVKAAWLSSWNGAGAGHDFGGPRRFEVVDAGTGAVVHAGRAALAVPEDAATTNAGRNFARADVWEMDFSALDAPGTYHLRVEGVGRSRDFEISEDHWGDVFATSAQGFYSQRSGLAKDADLTSFVHPRSLHPEDGRVTVHATDVRIMDTNEGYDGGAPDQFDLLVAGATDTVLPDAWGGWHDAGDWDRRTQHMEAARRLIDVVEMAPGWAAATDLAIPEAGDGVPDLLDEAAWGLSVFARLQGADGGVGGGIEAGSYRGHGAASWDEALDLYAYAPGPWSTWEFAASAAKLSRALAPHDGAAAAGWLDRADRAMAWAEAQPEEQDHQATLAKSRAIAALEMYAATGEARWHDLFLDLFPHARGGADLAWYEYDYQSAALYARLDPAMTDGAVAVRALAVLEGEGRVYLEAAEASAFGTHHHPYQPYGWGNAAPQPAAAADLFLPLHAATGEARWLEAMQANVQYGLGANPLNTVFTTGFDGVRSPEQILHGDADALGAGPPPGITLYGDHGIADYGRDWFHDVMAPALRPDPARAPDYESFHGFFGYVPSTEFTVQQGVTDMTTVTGYLAAQARASGLASPSMGDVGWATRPGATLGADAIRGTGGDDVLRVWAGDDLARGFAGDDALLGGPGADSLIGNAGDDTLWGGNGDDRLWGGARRRRRGRRARAGHRERRRRRRRPPRPPRRGDADGRGGGRTSSCCTRARARSSSATSIRARTGWSSTRRSPADRPTPGRRAPRGTATSCWIWRGGAGCG